MHFPPRPTRVALLAASTLLTAAACSFILDFQVCEHDSHCGEGFVCSASGECIAGEDDSEVVVFENITEDTVWESDRVYRLTKVIFIENGATLTIRAGTRIVGDQGSALVATRGSRLESRGTEFAPVVFTSSQPEEVRLPGDWGGVALLGRATVNEPNAVLEGLTDASRAAFGGTEDSWSCGVLEYTRIEYAGFPLEADEELNGLTLGGCGTGTIVDHVQVHFGDDDGVELFGGTVNLKHVVISRAQDDSLDWDRGWRGKAQFVAIIQDSEGDNGLECDNWSDGNDAEPRSDPTLYNVTLIGSKDPNASQRGATFKEGTAGVVRNAIFMGHPVESIDIKGEATVSQLENQGLSVGSSIFYAAGADGQHFFPSVQEEMGDNDDDGGFDEDFFFRADALNNQFGVDPLISDAYNLSAPGWVPGTVVAGTGATPPGDGFFDEAANYPGAFAPGALPWTENWTSFPEG